jgi:single-strand DNA-binding protein
MSTFNSVTLVGNCGNDPEIIRPDSKPPYAKLQIATNESWKKENVQCSRTDWHTILFYGKLVEIAEKYLHKGDKVLIRGKLRKNTWQDKDGNNRSSVYVEAKEVSFLTPKSDDAKTQSDYANSGHSADTHQEAEGVAANESDGDIDNDDIAF